MASRLQKITLLPAIVMFVLSILFALVTVLVVDFSLKQGLLVLTSSLFIGGLTYTTYWGYSWIWSKKLHERDNSFLLKILFKNTLIGIIVLAVGSVILGWISLLVLNDLFVWNKDFGTIFFSSRLGESIDLGIGMRVVHYFYIGFTFLLVGLVVLFHKFRSCTHYFGYLGSIYRKDPVIPLKCFKCQLKKDCLMTDNRSRFRNKTRIATTTTH